MWHFGLPTFTNRALVHNSIEPSEDGMHRLAYSTGILSHLHRARRQVSSSSTSRKSAADVEGGVTTWSYPAPVPDNGGLFPESSRAAMERARDIRRRQVVEREFGQLARWGEKSGKAKMAPFPVRLDDIARSAEADWMDQRRKPPDPSDNNMNNPSEPLNASRFETTMKNAMKRLLDIHSSPPLLPTCTSPQTDPQPPSLQADMLELSPERAVPAKHHPAPVRSPLPPVVKHLLDSRQYRLAVFHVLRTPQFCFNIDLLSRLADQLTHKRQLQLATRLRATVEAIEGGKRDMAKMEGARLEPVPIAGMKGKDFWTIPRAPKRQCSVPDTPVRSTAKGQRKLSEQMAFTAYLNSWLSAILHQPSSPSLTVTETPLKVPYHKLPPPQPSLRQLGQLLYTIDRMERQQGFKPDRVTANIILRCWLRCVQPIEFRNPHMDYEKNGRWFMTRREESGRVLTGRELLVLFRLVSNAMDASLRETEWRLKKGLEGLDKDCLAKLRQHLKWAKEAPPNLVLPKSNPPESVLQTELSGCSSDRAEDQTPKGTYGDLDFEKHVRPFTEMLLKSLALVGGREERYEVIGWKKAVRLRIAAADEAKAVLVLLEKHEAGTVGGNKGKTE